MFERKWSSVSKLSWGYDNAVVDRASQRSPGPTACNLCGTVGAVVECEKCQSMAFCSTCDDMYHRHPKRRFHLRKSLLYDKQPSTQTRAGIDLRSIAGRIFSKVTSDTKPTLNASFSGLRNSAAHPSKMPIPPPRRKKKDATLQGAMFTSNMQKFSSSNFRRFQLTENSKKNLEMQQQQQTNPMFTECQRSPSRTASLHQVNASFNEQRRSSYQSLTGSDVSADPWCQESQFDCVPPPLPQKTRNSQTTARRNLSLTNLCDNYNEPPINPYFGYPQPNFMPPWMPPSLAQSTDDFGEDDDQNLLPDYNPRGTLTRSSSRNTGESTMRRTQSFMQMNPWAMQYYSPYYYYPHYYPPPPPPPQFYRNQSSPPSSLRSMSIRRHREDDRGSNVSLSVRDSASVRSENITKTRKIKQKSANSMVNMRVQSRHPYSKSKQLSNNSLNGGISDSEEEIENESDEEQQEEEEKEEQYESFSEEDDEEEEEFSDGSLVYLSTKWGCKYCTFVNRAERDICEICSKSNKKRLAMKRQLKGRLQKNEVFIGEEKSMADRSGEVVSRAQNANRGQTQSDDASNPSKGEKCVAKNELLIEASKLISEMNATLKQSLHHLHGLDTNECTNVTNTSVNNDQSGAKKDKDKEKKKKKKKIACKTSKKSTVEIKTEVVTELSQPVAEVEQSVGEIEDKFEDKFEDAKEHITPEVTPEPIVINSHKDDAVSETSEENPIIDEIDSSGITAVDKIEEKPDGQTVQPIPIDEHSKEVLVKTDERDADEVDNNSSSESEEDDGEDEEIEESVKIEEVVKIEEIVGIEDNSENMEILETAENVGKVERVEIVENMENLENVKNVESVENVPVVENVESVENVTKKKTTDLLLTKQPRKTYECELCAGNFKLAEMVTMPSCEHSACIECLQQYFTVQIREKQKVVIPCPYCNQPEISPEDEDAVCNYLSILDQLLKVLLPEDLHELFQRKVRDRALQKDPSFRWCSQCSSGFLACDPNAKTITCPDCKAITCSQCKCLWQKQHIGISCEKFAQWKEANDPKFAEQFIDNHLRQFGIDCPQCKFHYELARGGCIHFHCVQCGHDFCGFCQMPFKMGDKCNQSEWCKKLGFHSHHPRNCLFYLRDRDVNDLKKLLDMHKIKYARETTEANKDKKKCPVMEQKWKIGEPWAGLVDASCGREVFSDGMCKSHYTEYLTELIRANRVDPVDILDEDEMVHLLRRASLKIPIKINPKQHINNLRQVIKEELPLC